MAVLKCKMCGGELTIREGVSIVKCDYCGNTNTLPKENSANNHDLFARANELRVRCEFDLAERAYEKIIEVAPQEAEAYWGLVLCQYGIEYVEDPKTKKRIPTCHRASFEAITTDYNYQKAIEYADVVSRPVYEEEARVIDAIQKEILALSYKEEKYDVFICYKETDNDGKRTEDSAIANDIYYQLTQEGYKVFYAAITLEDKLGQDYEPIIFAALNSAKVMLVVGTKTEYFNAVWVKNEWSRYLKIMKQDRTKLMFPCYKGISAYELPDELSHMQAQDMGKIGFINDLIRGIKKVIVKEKPKTEASSEVAATKVTPSKMNPTLRRAFIFIEDGNWEEANEYLEKVLDDEPENAFAYLGKLLIDLKVKKQEKLVDLAQTFDNNPNYKKAYKFADKELKERLAGYNEAISKRNEEKSKDEQYNVALTFVSKAKTEEDYKQAGKKFSALSGWKDSSRRAKDCFDKAEAIRKDAIYTKALALAQSKDPNEIKKAAPLFESIPDWKDSTEILVKIPDLCETARKNAIYEDALQKFNGTNIEKVKEAQKQFLTISEWKDAKQKAELCVKRIQELEEKEKQDKLAREKAERERQIAQAKKKKLIKKVSIISTSAVVAIATVIILLFTLILPTINFNKATDLLNAGKYDEAMAIYKELDGFGNSTNKINVIEAINIVEDGDYENGIEELLENGATVTISYDTAGGELNTINTMSVRSASATKGISLMSAITAYADDVNVETSFTYNNASEFEGLKPSTRNGYTFKKWTLVTCSPEITKDTNKVSLTFIAEWTAKSYTVTYNLDGGSVNGENVIGYNPDDESFTLINPTRIGYTFMGWTGTDLTEKTMEVTVPSGSYGNREYTANWQANTYTVTYNANGGTASKTEDTATYDEEFNFATVERKGYTFLGWFVGQTKYEDFDNWELTNGLDLVAEWKINTYTITYTLNGGNVTNTETYTVEDTVVINAPEKTGYTFDGWTGTGLSEETKSITLAKGTIGNKEYTANWTAKTYTVTFDANGGTASKTEDTATYDSNFTLATAERKGYEFVGWKADGKTYTTGDWKTDKNIELVAEWKVINYTISYNLDGGSITGTNPAAYTVEDSITLKNPTKTGYTFAGWTGTDLSGKTMTVTIAKGIIGNRSYTANWTANTYTLSFNANGGNAVSSKTVTYDSTYTVPTPTRDGYTFVAWKYNGKTYSGGTWEDLTDVTLTAEWTYYIVSTFTNDEKAGTYTVKTNEKTTAGQSVTVTAQTNAGYKWKGWYSNGTLKSSSLSYTFTMARSNVNLVATWEIINYNISYTLNGGSVTGTNPATYTVEDVVTLKNPTRTGYTFAGWTGTDLSGKTMTVTIAKGTIGNRSYTANWTANTYTLTYDVNGGNALADNTQSVIYDTNYSVVTPTRTGYSFVKWATSNGTVYSGGMWKTANDVTVIAEWSANTYTLNYNGNGGTPAKTNDTATYDKTFTLTTARRTGYEFVCWKYNGEEFISGKWNLTKDITLVAEWSPLSYTITYLGNEGTPSQSTQTVTFDTSPTLATASRTGYIFKGWFNGTQEYVSGNVWKTANDIILTAEWEARTDTVYTVRHHQQNIYDDDYIVFETDHLKGKSDASITPAVNTYTGFTSPKATTTTIAPNGSRVVDYYYTRNSYTITLISNGGTGSSITQKFESSLDKNSWSMREGFTFGEWYTDKTLVTEYTLTTMPAENQTVYAWWTEENKPTDFIYSGTTAITVSAYNGESTTMWIPAYIGGVPVTTIPAAAFKDQATLLKVVVPNTVTEIGNGAFQGCSLLEDITIPFVGKSATATYADAVFGYIFGQKSTRHDTTEGLAKADYHFYNYCPINSADGVWQYTNYTYYYSAWREYQPIVYHYYIPTTIRNVTITIQNEIPVAAFNSCEFIESITLPTTVTSIGDYAFQNCATLKKFNSTIDGEFNIPVGVDKIGQYTFKACGELVKVNIPANVISVETYAFNACTQLEEVKFAENSKLKTIGEYAFADCISISELQLPNTITNIGNYAFSGCISIAKVGSQEKGEMLLSEKLVSIGEYAFQNLSLISKIIVPDGVTSIGEGAFKGCDDVKEITLPFIGKKTDATAYEAVFGYIFGSKSTSYEMYTGGDKSLSFINKKVSNISGAVWQYTCKDLYVKDWSDYYDRSYYYYIPTTIRNVTITIQNEIPVAAFNSCEFIESITLPTTVTSIGDYAFQNCATLKKFNSTIDGEFNIPVGVDKIGQYTFKACGELVKVNIPANVISVETYAFNACTQLEEVKFAENSKLKTIGEYAFADCISISELQLPNTITNIGNYAFSGCISIAKVGSQEKGEMLLSEKLVSIGEYAFQNLSLISKIIVPDGVTSIGEGAFKGCSEIKDITLPFAGKSITASLEKSVFGYIFGYKVSTSGTGGSKREYFVNEIFSGSSTGVWQYSCSGSKWGNGYYDQNSYYYYIPTTIRNVTITVQTEIPIAAFNGCDFIESITLPTTVTSIGDYAFQNCNAVVSQTYIPTLSYWNGTNISTALLGEGTETNPYQINSAADLAYLSSSVNGGETYEGKYFTLNVNINLNSKAWTPIGTKATPFTGVFNGNSKKITNLSITADTAYAGLFGYVSGTIKNLAIESGIVAPKSTAASSYAGGMVGYLAGTVENCYANANITISTTNIVYSGGLVGYVDNAASVKDCYVSGNVSVTTTSGFAYAGGFVGSNKGLIESCLAFGDVKAKGQSDTYSRNGGFVATNSGTLTNCYRSEEQVLTKYTTTGATYCEEGTIASVGTMLRYAQTNWDSEIWEFEAKYPVFK